MMQDKQSQIVGPTTCCVIVNWNGWQDTLECLESLETQTCNNLHIIVVDNASTNDSVSRIRHAFPHVELIETGSNLGFPRGCNVGLRAALQHRPDYVWLLNNDTVCPPDTLMKLVQCGEQNPDAGLVGTVLYFMHAPDEVQAWGGGKIIPSLAHSTHFSTPHIFGKNSYLTFASVLARRQMLEEVGLLYEGYFMYYDDVDLALRMQETKWKIVVAEDTAVLHKEGGSTPKGENPFMIKTVTVSALRFIRRFSPFFMFSIPVYLLLRGGNRIFRREFRGFKAVLTGFIEFLREPMVR